uniref:Uncharacterized protein n=1 Tax=Lepeophtheirus salmonis TaxID=72036 RepID=A0A0K2VCE8_LEPSM
MTKIQTISSQNIMMDCDNIERYWKNN